MHPVSMSGFFSPSAGVRDRVLLVVRPPSRSDSAPHLIANTPKPSRAHWANLGLRCDGSCEFYQGASEAEKNVPVAYHEDIEADYMSELMQCVGLTEGIKEAGLGDREDPGAGAPADADGAALRGTRFWTFARPTE